MSNAAASPSAAELLRRGGVIPAHPLALTAERNLDERRQRALTRYYLAAGVIGVAVGVHTTQFGIHDPRVGLYAPVPATEAAREARDAGTRPVLVAGLVDDTWQAVAEVTPLFGFYLLPAVGGRALSLAF